MRRSAFWARPLYRSTGSQLSSAGISAASTFMMTSRRLSLRLAKAARRYERVSHTYETRSRTPPAGKAADKWCETSFLVQQGGSTRSLSLKMYRISHILRVTTPLQEHPIRRSAPKPSFRAITPGLEHRGLPTGRRRNPPAPCRGPPERAAPRRQSA